MNNKFKFNNELDFQHHIKLTNIIEKDMKIRNYENNLSFKIFGLLYQQIIPNQLDHDISQTIRNETNF